MCFGKERVERECSTGFFFNPRIGQCDRPENVDCTPDTSHLPSIECPKNNQVEFLPSLHACKSYFVCAAGRPSLHNCTRGLIFDIETNRCTTKGRCLLDYQPECTKNAAFLPHIYDCRHYYFCINNQPVLRACAPGLLFDIASLQCNLDPLATCAAPPRPSQPIWPNKKPARNIILWTFEFQSNLLPLRLWKQKLTKKKINCNKIPLGSSKSTIVRALLFPPISWHRELKERRLVGSVSNGGHQCVCRVHFSFLSFSCAHFHDFINHVIRSLVYGFQFTKLYVIVKYNQWCWLNLSESRMFILFNG